MIDENDRRFMVGPDRDIKPLDHEYDVREVDGQLVGAIKAVSIKQAKDLAGKVKKDFNLKDEQVNELLATVQRVEEHPGQLRRVILAGPAVEFPSAFTMSALFSAYHNLPVGSDFRTYIESFEEDTQPKPLPPATFYFIQSDSWFKLEAELGHCLILYGDPIREQIIFVSRLFNLLEVAVLMPFEGVEPVLQTYGVDILKGVETSVYVNTAVLCGFEWKQTHELGEELFSINQERGEKLMNLVSSYEFDRATKAIWTKYSTGAFTKDTLKAAFSEFCDLFNVMVLPENRETVIKEFKTLFISLGMDSNSSN